MLIYIDSSTTPAQLKGITYSTDINNKLKVNGSPLVINNNIDTTKTVSSINLNIKISKNILVKRCLFWQLRYFTYFE